MKNSLLFVTLGVSLAALALAGCTQSSDQKVQTATQTAAAATQELKEAREAYRAEWLAFKKDTEQVIEANGRSIDSLKTKIDKAGKRSQAVWGKDLAALEQKNAQLKQKLSTYNDQGKSNWETFKTDVSRDLERIGSAMRDLYKRVG